MSKRKTDPKAIDRRIRTLRTSVETYKQRGYIFPENRRRLRTMIDNLCDDLWDVYGETSPMQREKSWTLALISVDLENIYLGVIVTKMDGYCVMKVDVEKERAKCGMPLQLAKEECPEKMDPAVVSFIEADDWDNLLALLVRRETEENLEVQEQEWNVA